MKKPEQITAKNIADAVEDKINDLKELEHSEYYKFSDELASKIEDLVKQEVKKVRLLSNGDSEGCSECKKRKNTGIGTISDPRPSRDWG